MGERAERLQPLWRARSERFAEVAPEEVTADAREHQARRRGLGAHTSAHGHSGTFWRRR